MGIGHLGVGLAAKAIAPKAPLGVLLIASEAIDLLWGIFALTAIDTSRFSPWSHSLVMSVVWAIAAAVLAVRIYRDARTGVVIGLVVFSHWVLDLVSHPMGVLGLGSQPDLPLLLDGSSRVGFGLYSILSMGGVIAVELGLIILGLGIYLFARGMFAKER